jgi:tetratricopeptide (TPR) repeat protein
MWAQWMSRLDQVVEGVRSWPLGPSGGQQPEDQATMRAQYHLGRGRRAREAGQPERAIKEAQRALALAPRNPWAHALLGQSLLLSRSANLDHARRALEQARSLDPTNGYFVRLSLEILHAQRDAHGRTDLLHRAWWDGAPVERWLPNGPEPTAVSTLAAADRPEPASSRPVKSPTLIPAVKPASPVTAGAGRQPVPV